MFHYYRDSSVRRPGAAVSENLLMSKHIKLFIPGPVEVSPDTMAAMSQPMVGHRSKDFQNLYAEIQPHLKALLGTSQQVFLSTSSAWGVMEGSLRNLVAKKVLNCCCGAFSDKWFDVAKKCGKQAESYQVEWGQPIFCLLYTSPSPRDRG